MLEQVTDLVSTVSGGSSEVVNMYLLFLIIAILPTILILTTSFTRIIITLSFVRNSLGTQQTPPNQVLMGLALFLTLFIMQPVYSQMNEQAFEPLQAGEIATEEAMNRAAVPMKEFMLKQTRTKDLELFIELSKVEIPDKPVDTPLMTLVPAFAISELRTSFTIGFLIFIPFLIIDIVVASVLMSMGMFMLSPVMISMPFKLLLFVLVDGWYLVVESLVKGFM